MSTCRWPDKAKHPSFRAAIKARESLEAERGIDIALLPYRCGDLWHLGHRRKTTLAAIERRARRKGWV